jgi:hypothetical protein
MHFDRTARRKVSLTRTLSLATNIGGADPRPTAKLQEAANQRPLGDDGKLLPTGDVQFCTPTWHHRNWKREKLAKDRRGASWADRGAKAHAAAQSDSLARAPCPQAEA